MAVAAEQSLISAAGPIATTLPPSVALGIIAFLLSLIPAGFFIWLWYLRKRERGIQASVVAIAFVAGLLIVLPAFQLEDWANQLWKFLSPSTSHYFAGAVLPLLSLKDILLPAIGTFAVVATVEEGFRYLLMRIWFKRSAKINQISDGLIIGIAVGLGFATLENAIYFIDLFQSGSYDTLVFVFFLRFLISTLAHISFAGLMGAWIARGVFDLYTSRTHYLLAFFVPWLLHGMYDLLLGINQGLYAVLMLIPPIVVLTYWTRRRDFDIIYRKNGNLLAAAEAPETAEMAVAQRLMDTMETPWNVNAPWLSRSQSYRRVLALLQRES